MHLLLVEDDPRLTRTLVRLLVADSHVVDTAATARDALDLALSDTGIEAIVLDVGLPDGDGVSVRRGVRLPTWRRPPADLNVFIIVSDTGASLRCVPHI